MFLVARMVDVRARGLLEADFAEYYHLDLNELGGALAVAHAATLAANLPPASRTFRDLDGRLAWSAETYMLALVADQLAFLRYEESKRAGARNVRKPKPVQRPAERRAAKPRKISVTKRRLDQILTTPRDPSREVSPEEVGNHGV